MTERQKIINLPKKSQKTNVPQSQASSYNQNKKKQNSKIKGEE